MITLLAFLVAIGVLVTFHELGHFVVARLCGVKVLRFSIGFGSPILRWQTRKTEWVISPIPLGGYVRMLDEREGLVSPSERHLAFNNQSVFKRIAIVVAGPLTNLVLAVVFYWAVVIQGVPLLQPLVGTVLPETPAAAAGFIPGDKILAIDGKTIRDWGQIREALAGVDISTGHVVNFKVKTTSESVIERKLDVAPFGDKAIMAQSQGNVGLVPYRYLQTIADVEQGSPADRTGFKKGDQLVAVDGKPLSGWAVWVETIRNSPGKELAVTVKRNATLLELKVRPDAVQDDAGLAGRIGVAPIIDQPWLGSISFVDKAGPMQAVGIAAQRVVDTAWTSLTYLGRMLVGKASIDNLSGPLSIATVAGQTAREGVSAYLEFLALLSVSIGVLNLLPIPVLDGGHLMYYVAELIKGKPISEKAQMLGQKIGFILLASLMVFALLNDVSRLWGS